MTPSAVSSNENSILDIMRERRSVRQYDTNVSISRKELKELLELAVTAPSSSNLQHWRFLVFDTPERKQTLLPIANSQQQVAEASVVVAVLGDTQGYRKADQIYGQAEKAGYMTPELAQSFSERTKAMYSSLPPERVREVAVIDASLAAMQLMLAAKAKGYDTVPMGGFNREKFKETFGLGERYVPVMLLPIGKAAKPGHPTTRLPIDDVTFWNEIPAAQSGQTK